MSQKLMSVVPGDKGKSFGILAFSVTFKHKVRDAELLAGSLVNLPLSNDKTHVCEWNKYSDW